MKCPCGTEMIKSSGGWVCPDWFYDWSLGYDTSAHDQSKTAESEPIHGNDEAPPCTGETGEVSVI